MVVDFLGEMLYLSPVMCVPHRRAVKAVAGLDRTGLGVLTVFIPQNLSTVAVPRGPMSARGWKCQFPFASVLQNLFSHQQWLIIGSNISFPVVI